MRVLVQFAVALTLLVGTSAVGMAIVAPMWAQVQQDTQERIRGTLEAKAEADLLQVTVEKEVALLLADLRGAASIGAVGESRAEFRLLWAAVVARAGPDSPLQPELLEIRRLEAELFAAPAGLASEDILAAYAEAEEARTRAVVNNDLIHAYQGTRLRAPFGNDSIGELYTTAWVGIGHQRDALTEVDPFSPVPVAGRIVAAREGVAVALDLYLADLRTRLGEIATEAEGAGAGGLAGRLRAAADGLPAPEAPLSDVVAAFQAAAALAGDAAAAGVPLLRPFVGRMGGPASDVEILARAVESVAATVPDAERFFDVAVATEGFLDQTLAERSAAVAAVAEGLAVQMALEVAQAKIAEARLEQEFGQWTTIGAVVSVGAMVVLSIRVLQRLRRRIGAFQAAAASVAEGRFVGPAPRAERDEFDVLAEAWESMTRGLAERDRKVAAAQAGAARNERLAMLGSLAAGVAHEINNPLGFIKGNEQLNRDLVRALAADPAVPERARDTLGEVAIAMEENLMGAARIQSIVASLRQLAKPSRERQSVDLAAVARGAATLASGRKQRVEVHVELPPALPTVHGNPEELGQLVLNLVANAQDAMGGRAGAVVVHGRTGEGRVHLEVTDLGPGIPPEVQARLFEPFFTTKEDGTGLGLPISQRIAQEHGGHLRFRTSANGTTFVLDLPAEASPALPMPVVPVSMASAGGATRPRPDL